MGTMETFAGFPIKVDPTLGPDEIAIEHPDGRREVFRIDIENEKVERVAALSEQSQGESQKVGG